MSNNMLDQPNYIFTKKNVSYREYKIHKYVYGLSELYGIHVPRPYSYNHKTKEFKMHRIPNMNISDLYGDSHENVPKYMFDKIREIIIILYKHNVYYPDITGYNFVEYNGNIWILDFGHASIRKNIKNTFVKSFMEGLCEWNPEFC